MPISVNAQRGCCSHHGGVVGCSEDGRQICADGTYSPSCTCTPSTNRTYEPTQEPIYIYGCTDSNAINYNSSATKDDGSCIARKYGCMDSSAINYNSEANTEDNSCQYQKTITEEENIKYETTYKDNTKLIKDTTNTIQKGKNGKKEITYNAIVDSNGNVISKEKIDEKIIEEPVNEIYEKNKRRRINDKNNPFINENYICCSTYGHNRSRGFHTKYFNKLKQDLNLPNIKFYDLRHTYATLLAKAGFSVKAISTLLGHSTEIVTADVYIDTQTVIYDCLEILEPYIESVIPPQQDHIVYDYTNIDVDLDSYYDELMK